MAVAYGVYQLHCMQLFTLPCSFCLTGLSLLTGIPLLTRSVLYQNNVASPPQPCTYLHHTPYFNHSNLLAACHSFIQYNALQASQAKARLVQGLAALLQRRRARVQRAVLAAWQTAIQQVRWRECTSALPCVL